MRAVFPFSALVGQEELRLALLVNAVSPAIGGVLIRGEKGTAKSTAVRALARLLPQIEVVAGCPYNCDPADPDPECPAGPHEPGGATVARPAPLVELPVGASSDRLTGSLDLERALTEGVRAFQPGLLATAHRGLLYVDEVNLLADHLVDLLLDASALGTNYVERDGVSVRHASRFVLVGSMNPEEGELRPQLLDRFGLAVETRAGRDAGERAEIVRRRLAYERDPESFAARFAEADADLAARVRAARQRLACVRLPAPMLERIVTACARAGVDGLRADIVTAKAAIAIAAWEGRCEVSLDDVRRALALALPHRRRRGPLEPAGMEPGELDRLVSADGDDGSDRDPQGPGNGRPASSRRSGERHSVGGPPATGEHVLPASQPFRPARLALSGVGEGVFGRRSTAASEVGHPVAARQPACPVRDLAAVATLHAAAPHQRARGRRGPGLVLRRGDLREHVRVGREGNLVVFCVDASGSMAARRRMVAVKGAVLSLLRDAYQRRDRVAIVSFRGEGAELLLPPTSSVEVGAERLRVLPTGGRTPLAAGLARAGQVVAAERLREPRRRPLLVVVSDGRATAGREPLAEARCAARALAATGLAAIVIDTEEGPIRLGLAAELAAELGAVCVPLEELSAGSLVRALGRRAA